MCVFLGGEVAAYFCASTFTKRKLIFENGQV